MSKNKTITVRDFEVVDGIFADYSYVVNSRFDLEECHGERIVDNSEVTDISLLKLITVMFTFDVIISLDNLTKPQYEYILSKLKF
jgi:hypothetical protein